MMDEKEATEILGESRIAWLNCCIRGDSVKLNERWFSAKTLRAIAWVIETKEQRSAAREKQWTEEYQVHLKQEDEQSKG